MYNFVVNYQTEYFLNILVWLFTPHFVMNKFAVLFSLIFVFFCFKLYTVYMLFGFLIQKTQVTQPNNMYRYML